MRHESQALLCGSTKAGTPIKHSGNEMRMWCRRENIGKRFRTSGTFWEKPPYHLSTLTRSRCRIDWRAKQAGGPPRLPGRTARYLAVWCPPPPTSPSYSSLSPLLLLRQRQSRQWPSFCVAHMPYVRYTVYSHIQLYSLPCPSGPSPSAPRRVEPQDSAPGARSSSLLLPLLQGPLLLQGLLQGLLLLLRGSVPHGPGRRGAAVVVPVVVANVERPRQPEVPHRQLRPAAADQGQQCRARAWRLLLLLR